MANPISNTASLLPTQVGGVSRAAPSDALSSDDARQVFAGGGNATPAGSSPVSARTDSVASPEELEQATRQITSYMQNVSRSLEISVDGELGTTVIQVLDAETEEVVRQMPAEETLRFARFLAEQQAESADGPPVLGLLLDSEG